MDPFAKQTTSTKQPAVHSNSSFANALAEVEKPLSDSPVGDRQSSPNSLFSQALAKTGGRIGESSTSDFAQA